MNEEKKKLEEHESNLLPAAERSESARSEAQGGMPGLVSDRKQLIEFLKEGGRSGISFDFGKPSFVDSAQKESEPPSAGEAPADVERQAAVNKYRVKKRRHEEEHIDRPVELENVIARTVSQHAPDSLASPGRIDRRYVLGVEVALAAVIAAAGVARRRVEKAGALSQADERIQGRDNDTDWKEEPGEMPILEHGSVEQTDMDDDIDSVGAVRDDKEKVSSVARLVTHRPTIIVSSRDTLSGIAESAFHDPDLGWLIADLNRHNIKESMVDGKRVVELRSRQLLELPVRQDIEEFQRSRPAKASADNLVTIVLENALDRQELEIALGVAMGVSTAGSDPFGKPKLAKHFQKKIGT